MYQTVLSSGNGKTFSDRDGKTLTVIGNLHFLPGDSVWTDGRCIYGRIRPNQMNFLPEFGGLEGIPLNAPGLGSLLVYTRKHEIERYTWPKFNQSFANTLFKYGVDTPKPAIADMDIDENGKPWTVKISGAEYLWRRPVEFWIHAQGVDSKPKYQDVYHNAYNFYNWGEYTERYTYTENTEFTSESNPESNHSEQTESDLSIKNDPADYYAVSPYLVYGQAETTNKPAYITYDGAIQKTITLDTCAGYIEQYWYGLAEQYGGCDLWSDSLYSIDCTVADARIDGKGNFYIVVGASAQGYVFKQTQASITSLSRTRTQTTTCYDPVTIGGGIYYDKHETVIVNDTTTVSTEKANRYILGSLSCYATYIITNGGVEEVNRRYTYYTPINKIGNDYTPVEPPATNTYTVWEGTAIGAPPVYFGDFTSESYPPIELPEPYDTPYISIDAKTEIDKEYKMPIQDGYFCKNSDYTKIYKGDSLVISGFNEWGGIVALNAKTNEYLLLDKNNGFVFLYNDGNLSQLYTKIYMGTNTVPISTTNTRLRWMKNLSKLKK